MGICRAVRGACWRGYLIYATDDTSVVTTLGGQIVYQTTGLGDLAGNAEDSADIGRDFVLGKQRGESQERLSKF